MKRPLPLIVPPTGHAPTPRPLEGVVAWNMNTTCNYRCSYCTQRFLDDRGRWATDVPRFLRGFAKLEGPWELKLSGGEPFRHPHFVDVVAGLSAQGRRVSVVTNFSCDNDELLAFLSAAGDRLGVLSCSLHLEFVDAEIEGLALPGPVHKPDTLTKFLARCVAAQALLPEGASLVVTCVATRLVLPHLPVLLRRFDDAGVRFKVQPEKQGREVIDYSDGERVQLLQLGGHNGTGRIAPNFAGRPCWAGARSFIVDDRGDAYRCYPARRTRTEYLGNLLDDSFVLADTAAPCLYSYCNCTVPIARGMMPTDDAE
jgi:MoaA/NifB/PqqE/SkfB family radical SAM enzyme